MERRKVEIERMKLNTCRRFHFNDKISDIARNVF